MALTPTAAVLTEAHRTSQAARGAFVAYAGAQLWAKTVKPDELERTVSLWMRLMMALVRRERSKSARLTAAYYPRFRELEIPSAPKFDLPEIPQLLEEKLITSLRVTGPIAYQTKISDLKRLDLSPTLRKAMEDEAFTSAGKTSTAAAIRHTLDGGRDLMRAAAQADKVAIGWARVTQATPCYFCAMLASRGPIYGEHAFEDSDTLFSGGGRAKVHDSCQCAMEPSFSRQTEWPGRARDFENLWIASTGDVSGAEKVRAFRAAFEGREFKPRVRRR